MSALLAEAIKRLNLKPGQANGTTVQGHEVEVRRLDADPPGLSPEEPSQFADCVAAQSQTNESGAALS